QKMYEMVDGRKLQFNVNKELGAVVVRVVDSNTNQVLKEIPSEDMQKLKLRLRKAIGNLFDAKI
ncbi:MAG: flagellar protein FlaG, partial [Treponema sp.]|nr:flagellar protein FlaG [Treponema sp.]